MRLASSVRAGSASSPKLALACLLLAGGGGVARADLGATRWLNAAIRTSSANDARSPFYQPQPASDVFQGGTGSAPPPPARTVPAAVQPKTLPPAPALEAARARLQKAFVRYTRLVTSDEPGDVDAALEEYRAASAEVKKLEAAAKKATMPPH